MRKDYQVKFYYEKVQEITQITGKRLEKLYSKEIAAGLKNDDSPEKTANHIIRTEMAVLSHI